LHLSPALCQLPFAALSRDLPGERKKSDFSRDKLKASLEIYQVQLHAYVMNNHFHLMIQTPKANLSEFMNPRQKRAIR
jgi:REP element-mobilizing transposase RayT